MYTQTRPPESSPAREPLPGASEADGPPGELDALLRALRGDLRSVLGSLKRVVIVEWQRVQLRAIDVFFRVALYLCILGFGLAASISAALLIVRGTRTGLVAWSGSEWIGDLGGGIVILSIVIGSGLLARHHLRSEFVRKAKRALAQRRPQRSPDA